VTLTFSLFTTQDFGELVESCGENLPNGGKVLFYEDEAWDRDGFMEKLARTIEDYKANGGQVE
jgi:hypothetical protein